MSETVLEARGLVAYLTGAAGPRRVLDRVGLAARGGRTLALVGESGSGKTFLLQSLLGMHPGAPGLVAGEARLLGLDLLEGLWDFVRFEAGPLRLWKDVSGWRRALGRRLAGVVGRSVTLVPQDPQTALPPFHTVGNLVGHAIRGGRPGIPRGDLRREVLGWLERVRLYRVDEVAGLYPHELSGGMAQRVALALALAPRPRLLVADEPTTGLDATVRVQILDLLAESVASLGLTLLLITHDTEAARLLAEDVTVLCGGRVVEEGPADAVLGRGGGRHPYTRFLLACERRLVGEGAEADPVDRATAGRPSSSCPFGTRCPEFAAPVCGSGDVELVPVGPGHRAACRRING